MKLKFRLLLLTFVSLSLPAVFVQAGPPDFPMDWSLHSPLAGSKPGKDFRGTYPALTKSMNSGRVRSIWPDNVQQYGTPQLGTYNNKVYWMVPVQFAHAAPFLNNGFRDQGLVLVDAYACVCGGRVEHWIYKDSRTPVP